MATSLYRKYRPSAFADVLGQPTAVRVIQNSLRRKRVASAWLFAGAWGSGKTTCARLLAKGVNCTSFDSESGEACDECPSCNAINAGSSPDIIEVDSAAHGTVDDMRKLREGAAHRPSVSKRKVYILDEVHRLSASGFDTLLKTLEEPPAHCLFILASTEVEKIPNTILSRCIRLDFRRISLDATKESIRHICEKEHVDIAETAVAELARAANGSLRDAQSLLEQAIRLSDSGHIKASAVRRMLGLASPLLVEQLITTVCERDAGGALSLLSDAYARGLDPLAIANGLVDRLRNVLYVALGVVNAPVGSIWDSHADSLGAKGARLALETLAFDWLDSRADPTAVAVLLEVKLVSLIGRLSRR